MSTPNRGRTPFAVALQERRGTGLRFSRISTVFFLALSVMAIPCSRCRHDDVFHVERLSWLETHEGATRTRGR
jgi:hypothetical protein